jgi:hypothetical protein
LFSDIEVSTDGIEIGCESMTQINMFLEAHCVSHRFHNRSRYMVLFLSIDIIQIDRPIYLNLGLTYYYIMAHFTIKGGGDSPNTAAKLSNKDNYYVYSLPWVYEIVYTIVIS